MAKIQAVAIPVKIAKGLTAATFSTNGKKGKPARPKGMQDAEWWKVVANMRVPKAIKALQGIARLATLEGGEYTEKQSARIMEALQSRMEAIEQAFANPDKPVKVVVERFFK